MAGPQQRAGGAIDCFAEDCNLLPKILQKQIWIPFLQDTANFIASVKH